MHKIFCFPGKIVVHNMGNVGNIDASRYNVGCHQHTGTAPRGTTLLFQQAACGESHGVFPFRSRPASLQTQANFMTDGDIIARDRQRDLLGWSFLNAELGLGQMNLLARQIGG